MKTNRLWPIPSRQTSAPWPLSVELVKNRFTRTPFQLTRFCSVYWQWSASDLLGNTERGRLAEYIVATAVGVAGGVRSGWEPYDVETPSRIRVEVKASAYVQTWGQKALSKIVFGIRPTRAWDPEQNVFAEESRRQADVYVFAVLFERAKSDLDPLNLAQWQFYILSAHRLNERAPTQKSISLSSLLRLGALKVSYRQLANAIDVVGKTAKELTTRSLGHLIDDPFRRSYRPECSINGLASRSNLKSRRRRTD